MREEKSRDLEATTAQLNELQHQLEQQTTTHHADINSIREQHKEAMAAVMAQHCESDNGEELKELHQTNLELQMEVEHQQTVLSNLNQEKQACSDRAQELKDQVEGLEAQLQQQQSTSQERLDNLEAQLQQQQSTSQERMENLQQTLDQTRASAVAEITQTTTKLQDLEKLLQEETAHVKELTQQLTAAKSDQTRELELEQELETVTAMLSQHEESIAAHDASAKKAQQQLKQVKIEAQKIVAKLQSRVQEVQAQKSEVEGLLEAKTHEASAKEENLQLLTSELAKAHAATQQHQHAESDAMVNVRKQLQATKHALQERELECDQAQQRIVKLEKSKLTKEWVENVQNLHKERKQLSSSNKRLKAKLKAALENAKKNTSRENKVDDASAKEMQHLRSMVSEYENKLAQHAEYVHRLEANEAELKKLLEESKTATPSTHGMASTELEEELKEAKYKVEKYTRRLSKRETQLKTVCQQVKSTQNELESVKKEKQVSSFGQLLARSCSFTGVKKWPSLDSVKTVQSNDSYLNSFID